MVRKKTFNSLNKQDLLNKLKSTEYKKWDKNKLCWEAFDKNLINHDELEESLNKRQSIIPCYLYTHVKDQNIRDIIEKYVIQYSLLYSRGSYIANLCIQNSIFNIQIPENIPNEPFCELPYMLNDVNILKQCFYPERWSESTRSTTKALDSNIHTIMQENQNLLDCYLPQEKILSVSGWDNALNHMGNSYLGNSKVQILTHLYKRLKDIFSNINYLPCYPTNNIQNNDFEKLMKLRNFLNLENDQPIKNAFKEFNTPVWNLHLWLLKKINNNCSLLPVMTLNRKYAYIDQKIASFLILKKITNTPLLEILKITRSSFNNQRRKVRSKLRKRDKKYKKRKKWKYCGRSSLPQNVTIRSIYTNGIGLRLSCEFIPKRPIEYNDNELFPENSFLVGCDTGRVRLLTSCDNEGNVFMMKRKAYYYAQYHHQNNKWEKSRRVGDYKDALDAMSSGGGFKNGDSIIWKRMLTIQKNHFQVLFDEQVINKERAFKKMVRFRRKKSWMDRKCREFIQPAKTKHMIIGIGDGDFAPVGKGELAVPTEGLKQALNKAIKMLKLQRKIKIVILNEYNTSKCCHSCGHQMNCIKTHRGYECYRYRLCTHCVHKTNGKRRHRDVNASKNLLKLLEHRVKGLERPEYLKNPWNANINVALPPIVRTAHIP